MKIAICPGSFDPVTKGHLDIIRRTASMFDRVIVVVMHNYHKPNSYFSAIERVGLITRCVKDLDNVVVDMHDGLLAAYAQEKGAVAIVKGLRAVSDFDYDIEQSLTNKNLNPNIETVFITANSDYMYLSSSVVKQVCEFGGDISDFVPPEVHDDIVKRIRERSASK